jgi:hypothetical protein
MEAPVTTLFSGPDGRAEAAYVQLRNGPVARVDQPDQDAAVFLYVGSDDLVVGVKITAPISVEIQSGIRDACRAVPPRLVEPALRQVAQASRTLEQVL